MFGIGRRKEMKEIQSQTKSYVGNMEGTLRSIKDNLNSTIETAQKSQLPEYNIINQKGILTTHIVELQELLSKYKGKLAVTDLDIAQELAVDDLQMGVSELEQMVYSLKNMEIPTSDNIQDYFAEYEENYKIAMSGASLAAGVGVLATGGVALGSTLTVAGLTTGGIIGTSLLGAGSLLGGIGSIVAGPVGWVVGGIGLLSWVLSAPSKEEIAEAREELEKIQVKYQEIQNVYYETNKTRAKAEAVIRLSQNFTGMRVILSNLFRLNIDSLGNEMEKNMIENRRKLDKELTIELNETLNKVATAIYDTYRNKKRFIYFFKRKKKIWEAIENSKDINEALYLMKKYLRLGRIYKKNINRIWAIIGGLKAANYNFDSVEVPEFFNFANSYEVKEQELAEYKKDLIEERLEITSPYAKKKLKEMIDFVKLFKNVIKTPMINVETTSMSKVDGLEDMVSNKRVKIAMDKMGELKELEINRAAQLLLSDGTMTPDEKQFVLEKYPQWCDETTDLGNEDVKKGIFKNMIEQCKYDIGNIERLELDDEDLKAVGVTEFKNEIERY